MSRVIADAEVDVSDDFFRTSKYKHSEYETKCYDHSNTVDYDSEGEKHMLLEKKNYFKNQKSIKVKMIRKPYD